MLKRPHCCAFILGTALVLLAALAVIRTSSVSTARPTPDSARLALAVAHLNNSCLTCHSASTNESDPSLPAPDLAHPAADWLVSAAQFDAADPIMGASFARTPAATSDPRLLDLGWRLLSLPAREQARAGDVIDAYVTLAHAPASASLIDELPASDSSVVNRSANRQPRLRADLREGLLAILEAQVRDLEHRAAPLHVDAAPDCPLDGPTLAALQQAPHAPPTPGTLERAAWVTFPLAESWVVIETPHLGLPYEIIFGTQRRGPPAGGFADASVFFPVLDTRDCHRCDGSLSFFVWQAVPHQAACLMRFLPYPVVQRGYYVT